ncbi:MAG: glycosyltransferase family 39 protein, partial [Anaerolineaceae bacterium]|nr:glycosyltransferase family 39 protein [Anaerolineaceae bacterium]
MIADSLIPGTKIPLWWPALIPMLLAALFASIQLDDYAFNRDESDIVYSAGMYASGPGTLNEVWEFTGRVHPTLTQGWTTLLFVWGRLVGWSEPAIRSLAFLVALLALAWIYRTGRDLFSPQTALPASLLVSASVLFLAYGATARAFALALMFTAMILWSYGRLMLRSRPTGTGTLAV